MTLYALGKGRFQLSTSRTTRNTASLLKPLASYQPDYDGPNGFALRDAASSRAFGFAH